MTQNSGDMVSQKDYDRLRRLYDSLSTAVKQHEEENRRLNAANQLLLVEKAQWVQSKEKWGQIMQQTLTASNETSSKVSDEVQRLRAENTKLREELSNLRG